VTKDKRRAEIDRFLAQYRELGAPAGSPAEQVIWLVLARHGSADGAERAFRALWKRFVDVNEFRVAKATEISTVIGRYVRGDAITVAEEARAFLRRFHKDQHTIDFGATETMTIEQLRKYLAGLTEAVREMGLALFIHYCQRAQRSEEAATAEAAEAPENKAKKRGERDLAQLVDRLRLACAVAAKGEMVAKAREPLAAKALATAWAAGAAPEAQPLPGANPGPAPETEGARAPGDPVPGGTSRGKGATRPRTMRAVKTRQDKRSSRR
jgi:hypothetical protein